MFPHNFAILTSIAPVTSFISSKRSVMCVKYAVSFLSDAPKRSPTTPPEFSKIKEPESPRRQKGDVGG